MQKFGEVHARPKSRYLLSNFGIPSIYLEWLKIETSNLVCRLNARPANQNAKVGQKGRGLTSPTFVVFVPLLCGGVTRQNLDRQNLDRQNLDGEKRVFSARRNTNMK